MELPFTTEQFLGVFDDYNRTCIVAVAALWLMAVAVIVHVSRDPSRRSRRLSAYLGALWLWNAVVYHALFFTRINTPPHGCSPGCSSSRQSCSSGQRLSGASSTSRRLAGLRLSVSA